MKKKLTLSIVLLVALAVVLAFSVFAADAETTLTYEHNGDGGDGNTYKYTIDGDVVTIVGFEGTLGTVINIPETISDKTVTAIGAGAFSNKMSAITALTIPDTVTTIGDTAFSSYGTKNEGITTLTLPENLQYIGSRAFANYRSVTSIEIPAGVTEMGEDNPFAKNLATFTVAAGNTTFEINSNCIYNKVTKTVVCGNATTLSLPSDVEVIGAYAYDSWGVSAANYTFPATLTKIGDYAFNASATFSGSLTIPDSVTYIGDYAFSRNGNSNTVLTSLTLSADLEYLGKCTFSNYRGVSTLTIPSKVKEIGAWAFERWYALATLDLGNVEIIGEGAFDAYSNLGKNNGAGNSKLETLKIPDTTKTIGANAFLKCTALTTVEIGSGVETIGNYAFYEAKAIATLTFAENSSLKTIGDYAFTSNLATSGGSANQITELVIPDGVTHIGDYAFYKICQTLKKLELPDSVTYIGDHAFERNTNKNSTLTSLKLPANLTYIGAHAFNNYRGISSLTIPEGVKEIGDYAFYSWYALKNLDLGKVETIGDYAFFGNKNTTKFTTLTIPDTVKTIGTNAFRANPALTTITMGENVETIGDYAFKDNTALTTITIGNKVKTIGIYAFEGCSSLSTVVIPKSVETIGNAAFANTGKLYTAADADAGTETVRGNVYYEGTEAEYYAINWIVNDDGETQNNNMLLATRAYKHFNVCLGANDPAYATTHTNYTITGNVATCGVCGCSHNVFRSAAPVLKDNLAITYKVDATFFAEVPTVTFTMNGTTYEGVHIETKDGSYSFRFTDIAPHKISEVITATVTGGGLTATRGDYSIEDYCYNQLEKDVNASDTAFLRLLVDLLNYGTEAQKYAGRTEDYANAGLDTDAYSKYKANAGTFRTELTNSAKREGELEEGAEKAEWKSATLILEEAITMKFKFERKADIEDLKVFVNGTEVSAENIVDNEDGTYFVYYGVNANKMSDNVTVVVNDGEAAASKTLTYSVESYVKRMTEKETTEDAVVNLVKAMMIYGDAAVAYKA